MTSFVKIPFMALLAGVALVHASSNINGGVARRNGDTGIKVNPTITLKNGHLQIQSLGVTFSEPSTVALEIQAKQTKLRKANTNGDFDLAKSLLADIEELQTRDQKNPPLSITVADIAARLEAGDADRTLLKEDLTENIAKSTNELKLSLTSAIDTLRTDTEAAATLASQAVDSKFAEASITRDNKVKMLENKIASLETKLTQKTAQLVTAVDLKVNALEIDLRGIQRKDADKIAEQTRILGITNKAVTTLQKYQLPELDGWNQNTGTGLTTKCSAQHRGEMRRIKGTDDKHIESIVYCTGKAWKRISPVIGAANDHRLPGGGCVMRDVHSYRTTSGGCRTIDFKTNILARKATMFTIKVEGYNYGSSSSISSTASGYTYAHWSCSGSRSNQNHANGARIDQYCAGANVVIRMNMRGSYYAGMSLTASFLNPTGDNMCGNFRVLATKCNGRF